MLPKILQYTFAIEIPSIKKKVDFRPFLEKERQVLLMILETEASDIFEHLRKLIMACCMDPKLKIDDLTSFDVEYIFLQLRAKSIGEIMSPTFQCKNEISEEKVCDNIITVDVDLTKVTISPIELEYKVEINSELGVVFKYPTFKILEDLEKYSFDIESREYLYHLVAGCIDYIYDKDSVYHGKEHSTEDLIDFLTSLTFEQFKKIETFIQKIPMVQYHIKKKCNKCGYDHDFLLEGYESFFV